MTTLLKQLLFKMGLSGDIKLSDIDNHYIIKAWLDMDVLHIMLERINMSVPATKKVSPVELFSFIQVEVACGVLGCSPISYFSDAMSRLFNRVNELDFDRYTIILKGLKAGSKTLDEVAAETSNSWRTPMTLDAELHSLHAAVREKCRILGFVRYLTKLCLEHLRNM